MSMETESLQDVFDSAFAGISQAREAFTPQLTLREVGTITSIATGIAKVSGLPGVGFEEVLRFPGDLYGIAFNVDEAEIGVVLLGDYWQLHAGDEVERRGHVMDVPVGDGLIGRIINPLGRPLDGNGPVDSSARLPIERPAPPIMDRAPVTIPLQTGIKVIDALIPIGRGQRELIVGDRQTGKTAIALDTILNQRDQNVLCVYCAIGQRASGVAKVVAALRENNAMDYTIVVVTEGNDPPGLAYIAPYAATSIAEYFMKQGRDVPHTSCACLSRAVSAFASPARSRSVSRRHFLHTRATVGARNAFASGARWRIPDGPAYYRNRSAGHFSLHSDQSDFHHGRTDLPLAVAI